MIAHMPNMLSGRLARVAPLPGPAFSRAVRRAAAVLALAPALAWTLPWAPTAVAQTAADDFPAAATHFLDTELPDMESAVAAHDLGFFQQSMGRMLAFADHWGFKSRTNPALAPYAACIDSINDYAIVGLCRIVPNGEDCQPGLAAAFEANRQRCRALAQRR